MSLQHHFADGARAQGLITPGCGPSITHTSEYQAVAARGLARRQAAAALLRGANLDGVGRLDAAGGAGNPAAAEVLARAQEWAEFLGEKFPARGGQRFDRSHLHAASAIVESFVRQNRRARGTDAGARADSLAPMASQGLTYIQPEVYQIQHADLPAWEGRFLDIDKSIDPAAETYAWYEADNVGVARAGSSYDVTTIPMVAGPIASDNIGRIVPFLVGMETNFMDPRREALGVRMGKPDFQVEAMKRQACNRALAEAADALWFAGDPLLGIDGLMNHPLVQTLSIVGTWASKTPLQILDDLKTMVFAIANRSIGVLGDLGKVKIILPAAQSQGLIQPITAAGSASIMTFFNAYFKDLGRGVPRVDFDFRLSAANSQLYNGGPSVLARDTALIIYQTGDKTADPMFVLPQDIETPAPVRQTGVGEVTYYHMRAGGMRLPDARRLMYVVGL